MSRRLVILLLVTTAVIAVSAPAHAKTETWVEVRSAHFIVLTDGGEKPGRHVADQFERMRAVFHKEFPDARVDAASPIVVIAVRDKKGFQALEPEAYLKKGQLNLAGLFLQSPDRNYVLLRLDAEGDHPFATVYHEYTHFIMRRAAAWLPLWLNEGLAQFYENTEIGSKLVEIGEPSTENLILLSQNKLLPLATLFTVDYSSPYYHEETKGSIFYAESWALTHYLEIADLQHSTQHLIEYAKLVSGKVDPVTAATRAFGDLNVLEKNLQNYVGQRIFYHLKMPGALDLDESSYKAEAVSPAEADAVRADFLAFNQREQDARALIDRVLHDDPNNVSARETMGFLAFHAGKLDEAARWYGEAVNLDSKSFLAHYYYAAIAMREGQQRGSAAGRIEASLRMATKLNPSFAPAFDQLAVYYAGQNKNLEEALTLSLQAVSLEPGNLGFRFNRASLLVTAGRYQDAVLVLEATKKVASNSAETALIQTRLQELQRYLAARERNEKEDREASQRGPLVEELAADDEPEPSGASKPSGPPRTVTGKITDVRCSYPTRLKLRVEKGTAAVQLRAANYYKVEYSTLNFTPQGDLNPCKDLEGMKAKVTYFEVQGSAEGSITSIELSK